MRSVGWPEAGWVTDVALMDGGVQVVALWGTHILGRLPLPTRIGAFHLYERGPVATPVRCFVRGQRMGQHRVLADLAYVREDGRVVCTMHDLDFHLPAAATRRPTEPGAA
jgi:hypothetical protein